MKDKDVFPNLTYRTQGDSNVRKAHQALNGLTRPINDPVWDNIAPVKAWQCRCFLEQADQEATLTPDEVIKEIPPVPEDSIFKGNPGKTGRVFGENHPYFNVPLEAQKEIEDL